MSNKFRNFKRIALYFLIIHYSLLITNCSKRFDPEPLSLTAKQNLALLQSDPQFVMYFNFKKMRETEFWDKFISDSLLNSERNFGNFLYTLKQATGVSITKGIDELYFSNSWMGDNALVVKGAFDRNKIDEYIKTDTSYTKITHQKGFTVYKDEVKNFYFYFKDDFTVCASNYLNQIEATFDVKDTSQAGLLTNASALNTVENILHKEHLWMMSSQKLFIRGIFENFYDMQRVNKNETPGSSSGDSLSLKDSAETDAADLTAIYKNINAVSFSLKMSERIDLVMQNECEDVKSADELKNTLDGIITLTKISTSLSKKRPDAVVSLLDKLSLSVHDKTVLLELPVNEKQVTEIRKQKAF
ncbi:MAG: hypothetical protein ACRDFC_09470 [Ignavibacteria bacterium]